MALNLEQGSGLNFASPSAATGAAVTGLSGAATTHSTVAMIYAVNGTPAFKAAAAGTATPTTGFVSPPATPGTAEAITLTASQSRCIVWAVNAAGTVTLFAGPRVTWPNSSGTATGSPIPLLYPDVPSTYAVIAVHHLSAGSNLSGTFTVGSSNWNTTGITVGTVQNCAGYLPNVPITTP